MENRMRKISKSKEICNHNAKMRIIAVFELMGENFLELMKDTNP